MLFHLTQGPPSMRTQKESVSGLGAKTWACAFMVTADPTLKSKRAQPVAGAAVRLLWPTTPKPGPRSGVSRNCMGEVRDTSVAKLKAPTAVRALRQGKFWVGGLEPVGPVAMIR